MHDTNDIHVLFRTILKSIASGPRPYMSLVRKDHIFFVIGYVWCESSVHIGTVFMVFSFSTSLKRPFPMPPPPPSIACLTSISWHQGHTHSIHIPPPQTTTTNYCWVHIFICPMLGSIGCFLLLGI